MKGNTHITKLNIKKLVPLLLAGTIVTSTLTGCSSAPEIETTIEETFEDTKDTTYMDNAFDESTELGQKLETLEAMLEKNKLLEDIKVSSELYIDKNTVEQVNQTSLEDTETLLELSKDKTLTEEEQLAVDQKLTTLKYCTRKWLTYNATRTSIDVLKKAVKTAVCDAIDLSVEETGRISIDAAKSDPSDLGVSVGNGDKHYKVDANSVYGNMISTIYNLQQEPLYEDAVKYGEKAVNLIKVSAYSGAKLSDNTITSKYTYHQVKEKINQK